MNQNNQQNLHQVTPEELQKTLVLNLNDLEKTVIIEKKYSKKPVITIAIIGAIFLLFGSTFQVINIMQEKENEKLIEKRKEPETNERHISCTKTVLNNPTNTDDIYSFTYYFKNNKLISETKVLSVIPTPGKEITDEKIYKYKEEIKQKMKSSTGYNVYLTENESGFITTVEIDYERLDVTKLNPNQKNSILTEVDYKINTSEKEIKKDMKKQEFNCK